MAFDARLRRTNRHCSAVAALVASQGAAAAAHLLPILAPAYRARLAGRARRHRPLRRPLQEFCPRLYPPGDLAAAITLVAERGGVSREVVAGAVAAAHSWRRPSNPHSPLNLNTLPHPLPLANTSLLAALPPCLSTAALSLASRHGFDVGFRGGSHSVWLDNHPSAYSPDLHPHLASDIQHNLHKGWLLDVTELYAADSSLPGLVSPLSIIPKAQPGKYRQIFDGSATLGACVNDGVEPALHFPHPHCATVRSVCDAIAEARTRCAPGEHVHLVVADVAHAYRNLPVSPSQWWTLLQSFGGRTYAHTVSPFGLRSSSHHLHAATLPVLQHIAAATGVTPLLYVDDSIGATPASHSRTLQQATIAAFAAGGLPLSDKVDTTPSTSARYIGFIFDTVSNTFYLPPAKLASLRATLAGVHKATRMPTPALASLLGVLQHASQCTRNLGSFLAALRADLTRATGSWTHLSPQARSDLSMWHDYIYAFSGMTLISPPPPSIFIFSDASTSVGWGWHCPTLNLYGHGVWPPCLSHLDINALESVAGLIALLSVQPHCPPASSCCLFLDNTTAVSLVQKHRGKRSDLARIARTLCYYQELLTATLSPPPPPGLLDCRHQQHRGGPAEPRQSAPRGGRRLEGAVPPTIGGLLSAAGGAVADSTTTSGYAPQYASYAIFCTRYSLVTPPSTYHIPTTASDAVSVMTAFISHEAGRGLSASSIGSAMWALAHLWKTSPPLFTDLSAGHPRVRSSLSSLKAACLTPATHTLALPPSTLHHIHRVDPAEPVAALALMLGFGFFLRVSEYTTCDKTGTRLLVQHLTPTPTTLRINIFKSKTSTVPSHHERRASPGAPNCLLTLYNTYASTRTNNSPFAPALQFRDGSPVTDAHVKAWVFKLLTLSALATTGHGTHSLRAGGAVAALAHAKGDSYLMREGRWRSMASLRLYTRCLPEPGTRTTITALCPGLFAQAE